MYPDTNFTHKILPCINQSHISEVPWLQHRWYSEELGCVSQKGTSGSAVDQFCQVCCVSTGSPERDSVANAGRRAGVANHHLHHLLKPSSQFSQKTNHISWQAVLPYIGLIGAFWLGWYRSGAKGFSVVIMHYKSLLIQRHLAWMDKYLDYYASGGRFSADLFFAW